MIRNQADREVWQVPIAKSVAFMTKQKAGPIEDEVFSLAMCKQAFMKLRKRPWRAGAAAARIRLSPR